MLFMAAIAKSHVLEPHHICSLRIARSAARSPDLVIRREQDWIQNEP